MENHSFFFNFIYPPCSSFGTCSPPSLPSSSSSPPPFVAASDNVTFCQSAGKHATVAAGSTVAATEIDSNECGERKRNEEGERKRRGGQRGGGGQKTKWGKGGLKVSTRDERWRAGAERGLPSQVRDHLHPLRAASLVC